MADIRTEIANALHWDLSIPRHRVTAAVDNGVVTLRGVVERPYQRSHAETIARRVSGVIDVRNQISISAAEERSRRPHG